METKKIILAGGCFWCTEHDLREVLGVLDVLSGYIGRGENVPSYENHSGFSEGVEASYDPKKVTFKKLVQFFLDHIDPTDEGGQFFDRGGSYSTAIFYNTEEEKNIAESVIKELEESGVYQKKITVKVLPDSNFYPAEEYHQNYAEKNPEHYQAYKEGSGRGRFQRQVCEIREQKKIEWKD